MNNVNYKQLKLGKHNLPTWDALVAVALQIGLQQEEWKGKELTKKVVDSLDLPDDLKSLTYEKYPDDKIINNRVTWALSEGATGGLFIRPRRGVYKVTELGKQLLEKYGIKIDSKIVHRQPQYVAHQNEIKQRKKTVNSSGSISPEVDTDADDKELDATKIITDIDSAIGSYNKAVADDLLNRIRESEPEFF